MSSLSPKDRVSLCSFTFSDGRRCRTPRSSSHPHFCFDHAQKEARACAAQKLGKDLDYFFSGDYLSACDLSTALGRLIPAVLRGDVKPRAAHTVAYLAQTLMQAIHISQHEYCEAFGSDAWRRSIRNSVKGNYNYRFPPAPKPAPPAPPPDQAPHVVAGLQTGGGQPPQHAQAPQPAASPHPPLPPTSAAFAQHILAGRNLSRPGRETGGQQAPQPAQPQSAETPVNCHSDAETPINCHSERSRPTFSSAFAPASASACAVEESAASSNSSHATRHSSLPRTPAAPAPAPPPISATQSTRSAVPAPQSGPATQPFRSLALPPHVRRRLHRDLA